VHLAEFEDRKLHLKQGYSSLFDYCVRKLGYSDGSAQRRILSARCIKENPSLKTEFLKGKVNLCTLSLAGRSLKADQIKAEKIIGKSKKEVEVLVCKDSPVSKPKERIKPLVTKSVTPELVGDLFSPLVENKTVPNEERYELRFSVSKEIYEQFKTVQSRLSNSLGRDLSLERVFEKLTKSYLDSHLLADTKERDVSAAKENSRYISRSLKREVFRRDKEQCCYISPDGVRCNCKHYLEIDHIKPFALGGKSNLENLRLLCSQHNKYLAQRIFGEDRVAAAILSNK